MRCLLEPCSFELTPIGLGVKFIKAWMGAVAGFHHEIMARYKYCSVSLNIISSSLQNIFTCYSSCRVLTTSCLSHQNPRKFDRLWEIIECWHPQLQCEFLPFALEPWTLGARGPSLWANVTRKQPSRSWITSTRTVETLSTVRWHPPLFHGFIPGPQHRLRKGCLEYKLKLYSRE